MKLLVRLAIAAVLLLLLVLGLVLVFAGPLVKGAIETGGTWATGVETCVENVSAGLVGGELSIEGLTLANPPGFHAQPFLGLRAAHGAWETRSLFSDEIHVRELALDGLALRIERNAKGTNYGAILEHLKGLSGGAGGAQPPAEAGRRRTLVVDRIVVRDVLAELELADVPLAAGSYKVSVPRLQIDGFRSDGTTTEIVGKLLGAIVESALSASLDAGQGVFPADVLKDLRGKLKAAPGVLKEAQDALQKAGQSIEDLGGILKQKKK
jgi:hypothetical protein